MQSFSIITFGCKLNIYESESIIQRFNDAGYVFTKDISDAQLIIINSCTVTAKADSKCRAAARKIRSNNPQSILVITGCMVDADIEQVKRVHEANIIIGNTDKDKIITAVQDYIQNITMDGLYHFSTCDDGSFNHFTKSMSEHTRGFIKIQDGCNNYCSYCKIPYARGMSRSRDFNDIINEIRYLENNGYNEIVLNGINISDYSYEDINFSDLIRMILNETERVRIRLGSLEPQNIREDFYNVILNNRICPHFHVALQSGSDKILTLMKRKYLRKDFITIVDRIRQSRPDAFIATDIITGFPGESESDFSDTKLLIEEIQFADIHPFGYSPREGTAAYSMKDKIPERIRDERISQINVVRSFYNQKYIEQNIGCQRIVLIEKSSIPGYSRGKTENYLDVFIRNNSLIRGEIYKIRINHIDENGRVIANLL